MAKKWTDEDKELLRTLRKNGWKLVEIYESGHLPGRSVGALQTMSAILKITDPNDKKPWTNSDIWKLWIYIQQGHSRTEITEMTGRKKGTVNNQIFKHGLVHHPPLLDIPDSLKCEVEGLMEGK